MTIFDEHFASVVFDRVFLTVFWPNFPQCFGRHFCTVFFDEKFDTLFFWKRNVLSKIFDWYLSDEHFNKFSNRWQFKTVFLTAFMYDEHYWRALFSWQCFRQNFSSDFFGRAFSYCLFSNAEFVGVLSSSFVQKVHEEHSNTLFSSFVKCGYF